MVAGVDISRADVIPAMQKAAELPQAIQQAGTKDFNLEQLNKIISQVNEMFQKFLEFKSQYQKLAPAQQQDIRTPPVIPESERQRIEYFNELNIGALGKKIDVLIEKIFNPEFMALHGEKTLNKLHEDKELLRGMAKTYLIKNKDEIIKECVNMVKRSV